MMSELEFLFGVGWLFEAVAFFRGGQALADSAGVVW